MSAYPAAASKTMRVVAKGRVQGVCFTGTGQCILNAQQLGLNGWVRNKRDGSVEALFSGKPESITEMELRCRLGPPDAMVSGLQVDSVKSVHVYLFIQYHNSQG